MSQKQRVPQLKGFEEAQSAFDSDRQFVELGAGGRVVIPAPFRAALGMKPGDKLTVRLEGTELRIYTYREGIRRARELVRKHIPGGLGTVDEFIAERRQEAAREMKELDDE